MPRSQSLVALFVVGITAAAAATGAPVVRPGGVEAPVVPGEKVPADSAAIDEALNKVAGTPAFVELVERLRVTSRLPALLSLAGGENTPAQLAGAAARVAVALDDGGKVISAVLAKEPAEAGRLLTAIGIAGTPEALDLLERLILDPKIAPSVRLAAVFASGRCQPGGERLVALAKEGKLTGSLAQAAATAITMCPWRHLKAAAVGVLPMPAARSGGSLPGIESLVVRSDGDVQRGKGVFFGVGSCSKCHVVEGEGRAVGPNLVGIGTKLSRAALYESILKPSATINANYETHVVLLNDGRSFTGLLVSRSPAELVLRSVDGVDTTIPTADIDELVRQPMSLMPSDVAATLSLQQLVDLVAWLESLKAQDPPGQ